MNFSCSVGEVETITDRYSILVEVKASLYTNDDLKLGSLFKLLDFLTCLLESKQEHTDIHRHYIQHTYGIHTQVYIMIK